MPSCYGNFRQFECFLPCGNSKITLLWGFGLAFWNFEVDLVRGTVTTSKSKLVDVKRALTNQDEFPASEENSKNK